MLSTKIAEYYHPTHKANYDIKEVYPETDKYTTLEVLEKIIKPLTVMPDHRHYIIIHDAENIDARTFDKLLKTIEEPPSPTTFILIVEDENKLPITIRSRAYITVKVVQSSREDMISYLLSQGYDLEVSSEVTSYSKVSPSLLSILLKDRNVLEIYKKYINHPAWYKTKTPAKDVTEILSYANTITSSIIEGEFKESKEQKTPKAKAVLRGIILQGIAHRETLMSNQLQVIAGKYANINDEQDMKIELGEASKVGYELGKIEEARMNLRLYINPKYLLLTLLS